SSTTKRPVPEAPTNSPSPSSGVTTPSHMARPAAAAAAACNDPQNSAVNVGGFEIDGNLCSNNTANSDWDGAGAQPVAIDPVGNADTSGFTSGQSENTGPNWTEGQSTVGAISSGQARADFSNVYASTQVVGANVFAYFGFLLQGGTGTMSVHIEL